MDMSDEPRGGWWSCQGIFSPNYLRQHLRQHASLPSEHEMGRLYGAIRERWLDNLAALRKRKEAYTRQEFLNPTLTDLGWHYIPETDLPSPTRKVPDYSLFPNEDARRQAASADTYSDIFRISISMLEAKKAQHSLDQASKTETPGWFPSQQVQDYLWHAKDVTGRFFNWAILTNGNEWRLYSEKARTDAYFSFHLARDDQFCPIEEFPTFLALFSPAAFAQEPDGSCWLDALLSESLTHQEALEANLRKRVCTVLEELAEGYYFNSANALREQDLPRVYEASLVFLYRLLFVLYAESRGLLPAATHGPGSNKRYRDEFSLARFTERLRDRSNYADDAFPYLYQDLLKLFALINGTHKEQNEALQVTRYNGGLFDPERYPDIEKWVVGERTLARVLRQLMFVQPPPRSGAKQQVLQTDETVDFGTLEVRQLGDIYEGLLGARLAIARVPSGTSE